MSFIPLTGTGTAGAYQAGDKWGYQTAEKVRGNFDDHESRLTTVEAAGGTGDVVGPAIAADNGIPRYDGTTGKLLQGSGITIPDGASGTLQGSNSGDLTLAGTPNYLTIVGQVLTRALVNLASHVTGRLPFANLTAATAANRLLGRGSSAGAGDFQEIALGTGLSMSGSTLNATGGGASGALDDLTDTVITSPTTGDVLQYDGSEWANTAFPVGTGFLRSASGVYSAAKLKRTVGMIIGDGTNVISTGVQGFVSCPVAGTITKVRLLSSDAAVTSGSIVIDIWKDTFANYPPTNADSITASAQPTITTSTNSEDSTLSSWTTSVAAGDVFGFNVDSVTSLKRVTVELTVEE